MSPLEAAEALADRAIPCFPCGADKAPLTPRGFHDATLEHVPAIWSRAALVGVPAGIDSGFDILDVDAPGGLDWLAANEWRLPVTQRVRTRRGGYHIYFMARPGMRSSAGKVAPSVDIRAAGGYFIAWHLAGYPVENANVIADWPQWLAEAAQGPRARTANRAHGNAADLAPPNAAAVAALLNRMPNPPEASRDFWIQVMLAAKGCVDGLCDPDADQDIAEAAIDWAARWPGSQGYAFEESKWTDDFATRDAPLSGWPQLLTAATRLGVDTSAERANIAAAEFNSLGVLAEIVADRPAVRLLEITEDTAALAFAERYVGQFVFDHTDKRWLHFDRDGGWSPDECGLLPRTIRAFIREARVHWGEESSKSAAKIAFAGAVERGSQCDERFAVTAKVWDADPYVLGVPGGSVDLRTGAVLPAEPSRYVLRRCTVAPADRGTPEVWGRFLAEATGGDTDLQGWLHRLLGYALTGDVSEEMLAFFYGPGGNGKGVLLHTVSAIFGQYAYQAPTELFKADSRTNREYQLARLDGVRLLLASETEAGADLAESFVKEITGNEGKINARHPYGRPFEFRPQAKLIIVGNHAPKLSGRSPAMERRLRVVPFNRRPATPDPELKDKLVAEYPQILRWMVDGCLAWQRDRLGTAPAIGEASAAYFTEQDALSEWMGGQCDTGADMQHGSASLLQSFNGFLRGRGEKAIDARAFKEAMCQIDGIEAWHTKTGKVYKGIRLRSDSFPADW